MKRFLTLLMVLSMIFALAACGEDDKINSSGKKSTTAKSTTTTTKRSDTNDPLVSRNKIFTNGLDIELYFAAQPDYGTSLDWDKVDANTQIFDKDTLWEPGHIEVAYLWAKNVGTTALEFDLEINIVDETTSVNVFGNYLKLSNYLKAKLVPIDAETPTAFASRSDALFAVSTGHSLTECTDTDILHTDESKAYAFIVYLPEEVGNEANYQKDKPVPVIDLGLELLASASEQNIVLYTAKQPDYNENLDWVVFNTDTNIFDNGVLWEPGHVEVAYFWLKNDTLLDFDYALEIGVLNEITSINVFDEPFALSDYLKAQLIELDKAEAFPDRRDAKNAVTAKHGLTTYKAEDSLYAGEDRAFALIVYMPEEVGNEANYKRGAPVPEINMYLNLSTTRIS